MEKKYILALTKEPVDLSAFPEARVGPPGSPPPQTIGQVVLPRLARRLREEFPEFEVLPGCSKEDFENKKEIAQKVYRHSDFVVCTLPATAATCCCITKAHFAAMKKSAVFISLGRGQVLDEEALLQALRSGAIGGAALDVFQQEPLAAAAAAWSCPNLLLSPHNADWLQNHSSSSSTRVFLENLQCFLRGPRGPQDMSTPVDCSRGY
ncbi:D-3-phosphoglycerate dehydrogenase, putative [Eimeria necatrix]|uniref:D-3-phosphoglycerate dehydrogenase, putative n=1 Tax=Eimeria necatrix TaxID=51315 RepID=U6MKS5_9EIME|nr:D-3-phosphoglycerate dehydrogenase, putative [Eimeria necatrix]CDJ63673.1 D-3-phosphoglycerate dehydrogenase, putative [Eimeria necatrix]